MRRVPQDHRCRLRRTSFLRCARRLAIPAGDVIQAIATVVDAETSSGLTLERDDGAATEPDLRRRRNVRAAVRGLLSVFRPVIGSKRIPLLIIDTKKVVWDPKTLSARGAGILGMMKYGAKATFALDGDLNVLEDEVRGFVERHGSQPFLIFGFTFLVWPKLVTHFAGSGLDLSNAVIIHSGGWKKMEEMRVPNEVFRARIRELFHATQIYNFYGFVEQLGSIFLEGDDGLLYPPNYADVIVRDPRTLEPLSTGKTGLLQIVSLLPRSYPGHSILTEDLGVVEHIDNPGINRMGKGIRVIGRLPASELRGCSDVISAA